MLRSVLNRLILSLLALVACEIAHAQIAEQANGPAASASVPIEQVPRVPGLSTLFKGLNAGVTLSATHDSSIGWYAVMTPAASLTFSVHYSADVTATLYPYRKVQNPNPPTPTTQQLTPVLWDAGDTFIGFHAAYNPRWMRNITTVSLGVPTGDRSDGVSAGKVTFDVSDRAIHYFGQTGIFVDGGAGNSSLLFNRLVTRNYTSVGTLTHFQEGVVVWIRRRDYIQSAVYEQVPIGSQTLYTDAGPPGAPAVTVVTGNSLGRDNGVTTSIGIPLSAHITLSGYYNRSLLEHVDTVSAGFTYVLRGNPRNERPSMIDKALREAEIGK